MEWLTANWFWVVLGLGFMWLVSRGGLGCGMSGHGSHDAHGADEAKRASALNRRTGRADEGGKEATGVGGRRRHRGC
jgi:hypothetical protein